MYNINIIKKKLGVFDRKQGSTHIKTAVSKVVDKLIEISDALNIDRELVYSMDSYGIPFVGVTPSLFYYADANKLKNLPSVKVPIAFFVTGDAFNTADIGRFDDSLKKFEGLGLPRSHKIAQSLICKSIMDNPVYLGKKPLVPIGIDNYTFVSPEDVKKRLQVIKMYKKALEKRVPKREMPALRKVMKYAFSASEKDKTKVNLSMMKEIARIFPNSLRVSFTNEPPSATTHLSKQFSSDGSLAIVQMNYGIHPSFLEIKDNYYLYFNPNFNKDRESYMKQAKKCLFVGVLPIMDEMLNIQNPPNTSVKKILLSSGGAAGRIFRMIDELCKVKVDYKTEILALSGLEKGSRKFNRFSRFCKNKSNKTVIIVPIPSIGLKKLVSLYNKCHASVGLPGTYTALSGIACGRPFGAVIDSRKSPDKIFVDHFKSNALFIKNVLDYPTVIIKDSIKSQDIKKLLDPDFQNEAIGKLTENGGIKDWFLKANENWRDVFIYFLK